MNCDIAKEKIYEWVYENMNQLDDELMRHIADCPGCNSYYEDCKSARRITSLLNQKQPVLNNPLKLTNDILDTLNEHETEKKIVRFNVFNTVKRVLAAASVCLIIVFGYEQYEVVEKLIKLEEQMSAVQGVTFNSSHYQNIQYYYPIHKIRLLQSELVTRAFGSQDKDLKSLFIKARLRALSSDAISKRLQGQLSDYKLSSAELSILNAINIE